MKAYQDHDPVKDRGKAAPHPKRPTTHSYRGRFHYTLSREEIESARETRRQELERKRKPTAKAAPIHVGIFAAIACAIGLRKGRR